MSARSRAYNDLADHFAYLKKELEPWHFTRSIYTGEDVWDKAEDMARRTALESTWRSRSMTQWNRYTGTGGYPRKRIFRRRRK